jgi:hypothetical protein
MKAFEINISSIFTPSSPSKLHSYNLFIGLAQARVRIKGNTQTQSQNTSLPQAVNICFKPKPNAMKQIAE